MAPTICQLHNYRAYNNKMQILQPHEAKVLIFCSQHHVTALFESSSKTSSAALLVHCRLTYCPSMGPWCAIYLLIALVCRSDSTVQTSQEMLVQSRAVNHYQTVQLPQQDQKVKAKS
eukprot:scaffold293184_cov26-Prasinocladus_malaysianus.AAC.1